MKKRLFSLLLVAMSTLAAWSQNLEGFEYGKATAPDGTEWQSPERLGYNKLQPRACFTSFASAEEARRVLPEHSSRRLSLDGTWKFHFAKTPDERPADFFQLAYDCSAWDDISVPSCWNLVGLQKDGSQKYGTPIYVNQPVIFYHQVKKDDWREGVMRTPPTNWTTYEYRNEVGSYRRTFDVPKAWKGQELFVEFDGVDSFFYLWVNGQYVGFSKNSRDAARFDITRYAHVGENVIAVEVYRNSDGSFLEAQDMFRLPGIFRSVSVYATPKVHIQDLRANAMWLGKKGALNIDTQVKNLTGHTKEYKVQYSLYKNRLYSDENELVAGPTTAENLLTGITVKPWTGEEPQVYVLVAELKDHKGRTTEAVSTQIGFRTVQILDTEAEADEFGLAGRYFYVNGKPLKLKGVNRHETNPERGHAITRQQMEEEVMMMKRANINHVRTSHYSNDPYFYYLCNKYGIYLEAEANLESHEYYYGEASLSHPTEWRAAHVARMMELARARVNDPCIVIWSLGNEAGPGDNFKASYAALKALDVTRPVQYERNNDIVDMGSNQYPSVSWVRQAVKGQMGIKYPFHISEYAHSMGNAVGNLQDYWDAIESTNFFCGGAIWDWIDQSMMNYTKDGRRYLAYGGDFGDTPNDGQFVMNGILFGDETPKPQYYEVKKVYQYVGVTWHDAATGTIDIFNKNYYTDDLSGLALSYRLTADGQTAKAGAIDLGSVTPRTHKLVTIQGLRDGLDPGKDYLLHLTFTQKHDTPWAKAGYVQAEEQLSVQTAQQRPTLTINGKVNVGQPEDNKLAISGKNFKATLDLSKGTIYNLTYGDNTIIADGCGPELNAFRAWTNNDNWAYTGWYSNGLNNLLQHSTGYQLHNNNDGSVSIAFNVVSQAPCGYKLEGGTANWKKLVEYKDKPFGKDDFRFNSQVVYTFFADGSVESESAITSNKPSLTLAKLGYTVKIGNDKNHLCYYGRGPVDNYPDRKTGQMIGIYRQNDVKKEFVPFPKPQDTGNHQDTRWVALTDQAGNGAIFVAKDKMSFSALPWSDNALAMANHPYELPKSDATYLHLDMAITGLGGNSCGQGGPLSQDRVMATPHTFGYVIRPVSQTTDEDLLNAANVSLGGSTPLTLTRDANGNVSIAADKADKVIYYKVGNRKAQRYSAPVNLHDGGTIKAWVKGSEWLSTTQTFPRIENIPLTVVYASSVESGEGDADHLTDGNPTTYWHTMYSVTVANYPHWVDFDCGAVKTIKGFVYLPRQDSRNGNIKAYRIQVSNDGKNWGKAVAEGTFENNLKEKVVMLPTAVKARYVRFTALSEQNGQDFASGAEFKVLEK